MREYVIGQVRVWCALPLFAMSTWSAVCHVAFRAAAVKVAGVDERVA